MLAKAQQAQERAYAPYSNFKVGACIVTKDKTYFSGCNVENAVYGLTQCAEANAVGTMIAQGQAGIEEILIVGQGKLLCVPCGACRQLINEFGSEETKIHLCDDRGYQQTLTVGDLLPMAFGKINLES